VRTIQTQLRSLLTAPLAGGSNALSMLSQIGISVKDGTMAVDSTKLKSALASNFDDFASLFAANGTTTDSLIAYKSSTSKTQPGSYAVNVTKLATQGSTVASGAAGLTIEKGVNDTLVVQLDGISASVTLAAGTYDNASELAAEIQSQINGAADFVSAGSSAKVTASSSGVLTITSNRYGSASNAMINGGNGQDNLNLGGSATVTSGEDVAGTIDGIAATGSGQTLTAIAGNATGISLTITGGTTGSRGTVNFSQGYAYQYNTLVTAMLSSDGSIAASVDGINKSIDDIGDQETDINDRLNIMATRYRAQFTALEVTISKMNTTSTFLTQQLEALADLRKQLSS
jgi:flagellar hook-associated protein 2